MGLTGKIVNYLKSYAYKDEDPIVSAKRMINTTQRLVGIRDCFGDEKPFSAWSLIGITLFLVSFLYVGQFSQLVYLGSVYPDKVESFKSVNCISATCVPLSMYFFMWSSSKKLKKVFATARTGMDILRMDSPAHKIFKKQMQRTKLLSWIIVANQMFSHVTYLLIPFVFTLLDSKRYLPVTPGDTYGLSPKYETPYYELTYSLIIFATGFSAINQTGYTLLFVTILSHEIAHFYAISETLQHLKETLSDKTNNDEEKSKTTNSSLQFCIKHHIFLMKYHTMVNETFNRAFGWHFLMMTVVLITTLQTMNSWDKRNTIITGVTAVLPLLIYCFGGELQISALEKMSMSLYDSGWEMMTPRQGRTVLLMLCLSQRPVHLTAANMIVMNRDTFSNVVNTVYKVYTVFQ